MLFIDWMLPLLEHNNEWPAEALSRAIVFRIDNVAHCLHAMGASRKLPREALPNVAPLAPIMWFEFTGQAIGSNPEYSCGCLIMVGDREVDPDGWDRFDIPADIRWVLRAEYYYAFGTREPGVLHIPHWEYFISVRDDGRIAGQSPHPHPALTARNMDPDPKNRDTWHEPIEFSLASICFAHCKGVTIEDKQQPRQQRRAAERAGKRKLVTYKMLDIGPVTRILHDEGQVEKVGIERALHVVRAHFARYDSANPLFGKHTGTFYIPMHLRGKRERGISVKDYNIVPGFSGHGAQEL